MEGLKLIATAFAGGTALALFVFCIWWYRRH